MNTFESVDAHAQLMERLRPVGVISVGETYHPLGAPYDQDLETEPRTTVSTSIPTVEVEVPAQAKAEHVRSLPVMIKDLGAAYVHFARVVPGEIVRYVRGSEWWKSSRIRKLGQDVVHRADVVQDAIDDVIMPKRTFSKTQTRVLDRARKDSEQNGQSTIIRPEW